MALQHVLDTFEHAVGLRRLWRDRAVLDFKGRTKRAKLMPTVWRETSPPDCFLPVTSRKVVWLSPWLPAFKAGNLLPAVGCGYCYVAEAGTAVAFDRVARFSPSISIAGVTTKVRTVATTNPPAMADDSSVHHCVEGAP